MWLQKFTPGHKTFTWHLAGGKKCDLKVASVLVGGVIMFVSLPLPTRWGKKKTHQGSETDTEKANMTLHDEE